MSLFKTIKSNARLALRGSWAAAIGAGAALGGVALLLTGLETMALRLFVTPALLSNPTMEEPFDLARLTRDMLRFSWVELLITGGFVLLALLLLSPLRLGMARWYFRLAAGERPAFCELFYFFETPGRYGRAVWYHVQLSLRLFLGGLAFFVPPGGLGGISVWFLRTPGISRPTQVAAGVGLVLACVLLVLAAILFVVWSNRYALAAYLLCEPDAAGARAALRGSAMFTRGYRGTLLLFHLSFLGWHILIPLSMFLLLFYVAPYQYAASTLFCRYLTEKNRLTGAGATQEFSAVDTVK
jgi:uncharacterized membrane protein